MNIYFFFEFSFIIIIICFYRDRVDVEGLDQVAVGDGVSQGAVGPFVGVDGGHRGDGGAHSVGPLAQHGDVLLLRELGGVIVLVHDEHVHAGRRLRRDTTSHSEFMKNY